MLYILRSIYIYVLYLKGLRPEPPPCLWGPALHKMFLQAFSELRESSRNSCKNFGTAVWIRRK